MKESYENASTIVERLSTAIDFAMVKVSAPLILLTILIQTCWTHLTRGLQKDDYSFPYMFWFVPRKYYGVEMEYEHQNDQLSLIKATIWMEKFRLFPIRLLECIYHWICICYQLLPSGIIFTLHAVGIKCDISSIRQRCQRAAEGTAWKLENFWKSSGTCEKNLRRHWIPCGCDTVERFIQLKSFKHNNMHDTQFIWFIMTFSRLFHEFESLYALIFVIYFLWSLITICAVLLSLQIELVGWVAHFPKQ